MASVCLYFQVHQPRRLRRYSVFDTGADYFDDYRNVQILKKVADKCYLPATRLLLELIRRHDGQFRVAFSLTGCVLEQFRLHCPQMIYLLQDLAGTGCAEFLGETYYHSIAFLYSKEEFDAQVQQHERLMDDLLGQTPRVFRNTELIYNNDLASHLAITGRYAGILVEGADQVLGYRSPNFVYQPPGESADPGGLRLLLKNYRLSDDIAFRFSNRDWAGWPLTAEKFARWVHQINGNGYVCNLFMDYETFGEHQWADTGIFDFLQCLPDEVLKLGDNFATPSQCLEQFEPTGVYDVPDTISWADTERDLSAWMGNAMQANALHELYKLEQAIKKTGNTRLLEDWRWLTTSDHFYYMCTKFFDDGAVHRYFSPYESPYDSYINFMNVMDNLHSRLDERQQG